MEIRITTQSNAMPVPWKSGYALPRTFAVHIDDPSSPYLLDLELAVAEGEVECRAVKFEKRDGGKPVTPRNLREIRLHQYVRAAATAAALRVERTPSGGYRIAPVADEDLAEVHDLTRPTTTAQARLGPEHLEQVAEVYNAAARDRRPPTQAVQHHPSWAPIAYATASRWVRAAREAGLELEEWRPSAQRAVEALERSEKRPGRRGRKS